MLANDEPKSEGGLCAGFAQGQGSTKVTVVISRFVRVGRGEQSEGAGLCARFEQDRSPYLFTVVVSRFCSRGSGECGSKAHAVKEVAGIGRLSTDSRKARLR